MKAFIWFNGKRGGDHQSPVPGVAMRWVDASAVTLLTAEPANPFAHLDAELGI